MAEPCFECGAPSEADHHVVPRSRGGTKTVPLCGECHAKAHHSDGRMASRQLTRDALRAKMARGERVGRIRFGYDLAEDGVHLVENRTEQDFVRLMESWRATGRTYRAIVAALHEKGIPTKDGGPWQPSTIKKILERAAGPGYR